MARMTKERLEKLKYGISQDGVWCVSCPSYQLRKTLEEIEACWAERDAVRTALVKITIGLIGIGFVMGFATALRWSEAGQDAMWLKLERPRVLIVVTKEGDGIVATKLFPGIYWVGLEDEEERDLDVRIKAESIAASAGPAR